jgi:hypothetical protein
MLIGTIPREVCYFFWGARVQAMQRIRNLTPIVAAAVGLLALAPNASAEDVLKVALAQRGAWDSAAPELGQQDGIFKKHGIVLDLLYAKQDGETESSVISGSADRETLEWMYSDPTALKRYAEFAGVSESLARRLRDEFFTKSLLSPDKILGLKTIVKAAVALSYIRGPLAKKQVTELIQIRLCGALVRGFGFSLHNRHDHPHSSPP